jgi:purine-binding chemotaxis protein CheW
MTPDLTRASKTATATTTAEILDDELEYVTLQIDDQMFGLLIKDVHEVFSAVQVTRVPLAPAAVRGLLNLRGRVVTAMCLRTLLRMPEATSQSERMAIGVEIGGEPFALLVDRIGDVLRLPVSTLEANPIHMNVDWQGMSRGVHRLDGRILVVLDLAHTIGSEKFAA